MFKAHLDNRKNHIDEHDKRQRQEEDGVAEGARDRRNSLRRDCDDAVLG